MVSFDVKFLFTSVPPEKTIDIVLERICLRKKIETILTKKEMKRLLIWCTRNVLFTFNNEIYIQNDGVAGITTRPDTSRNFHGRTWKYASSQIEATY